MNIKIDINNMPKLTERERLVKTSSLLEENGVELPIVLCNFGIYNQYELAGKRIRFELQLRDIDGDDIELPDEVENKIYDLLDFIDEDWIKDNYGEDGQNTLALDQEGELDVWDLEL